MPPSSRVELGTGDVPAYRRTMRRVLDLSVSVVYGGHGGPFGAARLAEIAEDYLRSRRGPEEI